MADLGAYYQGRPCVPLLWFSDPKIFASLARTRGYPNTPEAYFSWHKQHATDTTKVHLSIIYLDNLEKANGISLWDIVIKFQPITRVTFS